MKHIRLSICIPTYNFGSFIAETLKSIIKQETDEIEIVVVDGASTDNTREIVCSFQEYFHRLIYHRRKINIGVDKDLARAVELAQGEYCWLMSSDDVLKPGAIRRVLAEIELGYDIYLCNRTVSDLYLNPVKERLWLSKKISDRVFNFSIRSEMINYFNESQSIGALFSYISSIIFFRKKWNKVECDQIFWGSNYAHVFRLFSIAKNGGLLKYIKDSLVLCRGDNDSFRDRGIINRFLIDLKGYSLLADNLFPGDIIAQKEFKSVMQREHVWYMLAGLRSKVGDIEKWNEFESRLLTFGYSHKKLFIIRTLGSSPLIMTIMRYIRGKIKSRIEGERTASNKSFKGF